MKIVVTRIVPVDETQLRGGLFSVDDFGHGATAQQVGKDGFGRFDHTVVKLDLFQSENGFFDAFVGNGGGVDPPQRPTSDVAQDVLPRSVAVVGGFMAGNIGVTEVDQLQNRGDLRRRRFVKIGKI